MTRQLHHLTSVVFSHYVEKARWGLERFAVPYTEAKYMPLFHFAPVYLLHRGKQGRRDKVSSRLSTPVLRTPSGRLICDSREILRYLSDTYAPVGHSLYGLSGMAELEQRLHDRLGPHARRVVYASCFAKPSLLIDLARDNVGVAQATAFRLLFPLTRLSMTQLLSLRGTSTQRSIDITRRELDWVSELLADGRPFLLGDRFSAADLSFACMAAPAVIPPEYGAVLPSVDELPDDARALIKDCRATPAGQFALRMFAEERRRVVSAESSPRSEGPSSSDVAASF